MLQIAFSVFLSFLFFRVIKKDDTVDNFTAAAFILIPAIIVLITNALIFATDAPEWITYFFQLSYFIVPALLLKAISDYSHPKILSYSAIVMGIHVAGILLFLMI